MNKRWLMRSGSIATVAALLVLGAFAGMLYSAEDDPGRSRQITKEQALAKVATVTGLDRASLVVGADVEGFASRAVTVRGPGVEAAVNVTTGDLDLLTLSDRIPTSRQDRIGSGRAVAASREFAANNSIDLRGLAPEVRFIEHGEFAEYQVTWTRRVHGALVPDQRLFSINPQTAEVFGLVNIRRPFEELGPPLISADDALDAAIASFSGDVTFQSSDLVLRFTPQGEQVLRWELLFEESDEYGYLVGRHIAVDAMTGQILPE